MQTSVTFKNIDPSDHLKAYVTEKLNRFDKLLDNPAEANVVLTVEKFRHISDININGDRLSINSTEETDDMYSAIDMALDKLEKQIKKSKEKIKQRRGGAKSKSQGVDTQAQTITDEDNVRQIKTKNIEYKPMDVEEAGLQLDLLSDTFLVFTNARTDQVNVIYRRKDGHFGLIQPSN